MPSNNAHLVFLLDGPFQSWGFTSRFERRMTGSHPTKSAVIGLCAAALGIDKYGPDESERLAALTALRLATYRLPRIDRGRDLPAVRLLDYHTVGGGYDRDDPDQVLHIPRRAERGPAENATLTRREYLLDARFGIVLSGEEKIVASLPVAFANPRWGLWLGRKCCIPATPIIPELQTDRDAAFRALLRLAGLPEHRVEIQFEKTEEVEADEYRVDLVADVPVAFGERRFGLRRIRTVAAQRPT